MRDFRQIKGAKMNSYYYIIYIFTEIFTELPLRSHVFLRNFAKCEKATQAIGGDNQMNTVHLN